MCAVPDGRPSREPHCRAVYREDGGAGGKIVKYKWKKLSLFDIIIFEREAFLYDKSELN